MTLRNELAVLTVKAKNYIRSGQISMYSETLKEMADLFQKSGHLNNQTKVLLLAFYIDLSGFGRAPFIDHNVIDALRAPVQCGSVDVSWLECTFSECIQPDMISQHVLGLKDCWYLLRLCIEGKIEQAEYILTKI